MTAIVLGLCSGVSWGMADFLGGLASRRAAALAVVALSQGVGLLIALAALGVVQPPVPPAADIVLAMLAGVCGVIGLIAFYRALAVGSMSVIAPVSALGAVVPVAIDLVRGTDPAPTVLGGMALALCGAALVARGEGPSSHYGVGLAALAAVGFGGFFALLAEAAHGGSALWALIGARAASVPLAIVAAAGIGIGLRAVRGPVLLMTALAGVLDASANLMYAAGSQRGLTSVVAVLGSLYPVTTVALAGVVLRERLGRIQAAGALLALAGVAMIAAG